MSKGLILFPLGIWTPPLTKCCCPTRACSPELPEHHFLHHPVCAITGTLTIVAGFVFSRNRFFYRNTFMLIISFTMLFNGGMIPPTW